jgi:murein DD-endopeptidase MepM/ murein hydrolase activator NlpD
MRDKAKVSAIRSVLLRALLFVFALGATCTQNNSTAQTGLVGIAPTSVASSVMRGNAGAFNASRPGGRHHTGVDIVARISSKDKTTYKVVAVAKGKIAYASYNGDVDTGYGYTVIIDHGTGVYTLYGHLATVASSNLVKVGQDVGVGQTIGYMADLANNEKSSGNVLAAVVGKYDKIQLHFEEFLAPAGRHSQASINDDIKKLDSHLVDPTEQLRSLGYETYKD